MKHTAIKKYLVNATISQNEIDLIQGLIEENNNSLDDYLLEDSKQETLNKFLSAAFCMYDENKGFINSIISAHPLKHKAVSQYFLTIHVGENEIKLLQRFIKDNNNTLKDYIVDDNLITYNISNVGNNKRTYILSKLLKSALSKYEVYKDFVQEILALHDNTNSIAFYWALANDTNGLRLIKEHPKYNITDEQLEKSANMNIDIMFRYKNMHIKNAEIIFPVYSKAILLLQDSRVRKSIIKEYFSPNLEEHDLYAYNEDNFFNHLGLTKESILNDGFLEQYKNDFCRKTIENIIDRLDFDSNEKQKVLLDFTLPNKKDNSNKKKI